MLRPNGTQDRSSAAVVVGGFYTVILSHRDAAYAAGILICMRREWPQTSVSPRHATPSVSPSERNQTETMMNIQRYITMSPLTMARHFASRGAKGWGWYHRAKEDIAKGTEDPLPYPENTQANLERKKNIFGIGRVGRRQRNQWQNGV